MTEVFVLGSLILAHLLAAALVTGVVYIQQRCDPAATTTVVYQPRDFRIGVTWDRRGDSLTVWLCLIPFFPIRVTEVNRR